MENSVLDKTKFIYVYIEKLLARVRFIYQQWEFEQCFRKFWFHFDVKGEVMLSMFPVRHRASFLAHAKNSEHKIKKKKKLIQ